MQHKKFSIPDQLNTNEINDNPLLLEQNLHARQEGMKYLTDGFWLNFPALLTLVSCTNLDQSSYPALTEAAFCVGTSSVDLKTQKNNQQAAKKINTPQRASYHSDSEARRIDHLENRRHGWLSQSYTSSNSGLKAGKFSSENFDAASQKKISLPWTRIQFLLNDRWRLDATLPDMENFVDNRNLSFILPIPRLSYELGHVKLSTLFIPNASDYNMINVMGVYLSVSF